jgi:transcriptional regulator with XRE-family HTH domain
MDEEHLLASSRRPRRLATKMRDETYRNRYVESHNRRTIAQQMREFRGEMSQTEFARKIGTSQQIVSRLENPNYHGWTAATFFAVARKLGVAAIMRFIDFPTFLKYSNDLSEEAMCPQPYDQTAVDAFVDEYETAIETTEGFERQQKGVTALEVLDFSEGQHARTKVSARNDNTVLTFNVPPAARG